MKKAVLSIAAAAVFFGLMACSSQNNPLDPGNNLSNPGLSSSLLGQKNKDFDTIAFTADPQFAQIVGGTVTLKHDHIVLTANFTGIPAQIPFTVAQNGDWKVIVEFKDGSGSVVYTANGEIVNKTGSLLVVINKKSGPIFWNKLGSVTEVQNSEIGVDGTIVGTASFDPAQFGNGIDFTYGSWAAFDNLFGTASYTAWTIEGWVRAKDAYSPTYGTRANPAWFTGQASAAGGITYPVFYIASDHDIYPPTGGISVMSLNVTFQESIDTTMTYIFYFSDANHFVAGDLFHFAVVVDLSLPVGDKIKLMINGAPASLASKTVYDSEDTGFPLTSFQFPAYCQVGERLFSPDWAAYDCIDNLKVYDYVKTDFSDRFTE